MSSVAPINTARYVSCKQNQNTTSNKTISNNQPISQNSKNKKYIAPVIMTIILAFGGIAFLLKTKSLNFFKSNTCEKTFSAVKESAKEINEGIQTTDKASEKLATKITSTIKEELSPIEKAKQEYIDVKKIIEKIKSNNTTDFSTSAQIKIIGNNPGKKSEKTLEEYFQDGTIRKTTFNPAQGIIARIEKQSKPIDGKCSEAEIFEYFMGDKLISYKRNSIQIPKIYKTELPDLQTIA